jgi:hypothetical protein
MLPIVGLLEENRGGEKEEEKERMNNAEIHHIFVGTRHHEMH